MCGGSSDDDDDSFFGKTMGVVNDAVGAYVAVQSGGTVSYDNGEFGKGKVVEKSIDFYKDISGASAAEEANADARTRLAEEKATALQDREDARAQNAADQLALSRQASTTRGSTARATSSRRRTNRFSQLGGEEQDFLGL